MQYMLIFHETAAELATRTDPEKAPAYFGAWQSYVNDIARAGIVVFGTGLQPPDTATTVRLRGEERQVHDGSFADTHEHFGGFYVIEVDGLDEALAWASRAPSSLAGSTEVRPVLPPPPAQ